MQRRTTNAGPERAYSEYNMWLQPSTASGFAPVRVSAEEGVPAIAPAELAEGLVRLFGEGSVSPDSARVIALSTDASLPPEGYRLEGSEAGARITGGAKGGVLYGVFRFLLRLGMGDSLEAIREESAPAVSRRVINHWDNADGRIERGYAGQSLFFRGGTLCYDEARIRDYARFLATVGINAVAVNNVNVSLETARLISADMLPEVARLAGIFRPYGVRLLLSVHFESPVMLGGLSSADPLDGEVVSWWSERVNDVYRYIPDLAGFLMKADSEFRGGPHALGRTQAEGANMLARALAPHGGEVYWRCFIYNCMQDWRDTVTDRPKAAYETFKALDGLFDSNVILQVKNGPSDFQVREPISPLLGNLEHTPEALELQIAQEYTGQQVDLFNLAVLWQEVLESEVDEGLRVRDLFGNKITAMVAVSNTGDDENWTGHTLAQANLYAYGRMAWNPRLTAKEITEEWVKLTFGQDKTLLYSLSGIMLRSRYAYENYTTPMALCWMVNIHTHYGPSPDGYEYMKWGTYHRADTTALGVDRTSAGTGLTKQFRPCLTKLYDDRATCPEELLLYFHRVPYSYVLKNGRTLLQHLYDCHFEGAEEAKCFAAVWESLKEKLPESAYESVRERFARQVEDAREWRDVFNTYFYRKTGIPDDKGRKIFE